MTPDGTKVYVTNFGSGANSVTVFHASDNSFVATIAVGNFPLGVAFSPDSSKAYIGNNGASGGNISVINTSSNSVFATIPVGGGLGTYGIAIAPDGLKGYVATDPSYILVFDTSSNTVSSTITFPTNSYPTGLSITPDGAQLYSMNEGLNNVSIIDTSTYAFSATLTVGTDPYTLATFIQSAAFNSPQIDVVSNWW